MKYRFALFALVTASLLGLAGCAGFGSVTSDVASYGAWPSERKPASFAFERLPSQAKNTQRQDKLEAAATAALERVGFSRAPDTKHADVLVMTGARISLEEANPWDDPFWWQYRNSFWRHGPSVYAYPYPYSYYYFGNRRYDREVALVLRDRHSSEVLYEARASSNGATAGDAGLLGAMFEAALADFPRTNSEKHSVSVQLPHR